MRRGSRVRSSLYGLLAFASVLLILEALARLGGTVASDAAAIRESPREDWFVYSAALGWEKRPGYRGKSFRILREFDADGLLTVDSGELSPSDRTQVVFLGDSNTFGSHVRPDQTFVEVVEDLLPAVDAVNLGVPGYTSFQGRKQLESAMKSAPDVVVISFGFNDRRVVRSPGEIDGDAKFRDIRDRSVRSRVNDAARILHLYRAVGGAARWLGLGEDGGEEEAPSTPERMPVRVAPDDYRDNLIAMVETAKRGGARVLLLVLGDNPAQTGYLSEGIRALEGGDPREAILNLRIARTGLPMFADMARLSLAASYRAAGSEDLAEEAVFLEHPMGIHGGGVRYLDRVYQDLMREVGRLTGAEVVEGSEVLSRTPWVYVDHCHFDAEGHRRIGEILAAKLAERG